MLHGAPLYLTAPPMDLGPEAMGQNQVGARP